MDERPDILRGNRCSVRRYRADDAPRLAALAAAFDVARWMTARFPHPYTLADALTWLTQVTAPRSGENSADNRAIEVDGLLVGGVGLEPHAGESDGVAEFGYWLGCDYWRRGIATEAAQLFSAHAFEKLRLRRLEAHVFAPNFASARVLEKAGFRREAILRAAFSERNGTVVDGLLYARLHADRSQ